MKREIRLAGRNPRTMHELSTVAIVDARDERALVKNFQMLGYVRVELIPTGREIQ